MKCVSDSPRGPRGAPARRGRGGQRGAPAGGDASDGSAVDVLVVGAGPAGLSAAAEAAERGLGVKVLDPSLSSPWPNNYGAWQDELEALGYGECAARVWERSAVYLPEKKIPLQRKYSRIDRAKLKRQLVQRIQKCGGSLDEDAVAGFQSGGDACSLPLKSGRIARARVVLDASGYPGKLTGSPSYDPLGPGYQAAIGITIRCPGGHGFPVNEMVFMDWTSAHLEGTELESTAEKIPTFLYAMPFDEEVAFVEETSLVARPSASLDLCRDRLHARLRYMGLQYQLEDPEEELCMIPMGGRLPEHPRKQSAPVPIGAAGGLVHPATGYSVVRSLSAAKRIADGLSKSGVIDASLVWSALWVESEARRRAFFLFGMEVLLALNLSGLRSFFDGFFHLEQRLWQGFLSGTLTLPELLELGVKLFVTASVRTKGNLLLEGGVRLPMLAQLTAQSGDARAYRQPASG